MGFFDFLKKIPKAVDKATEIQPVKELFPVVGQIDAAKDALKGIVVNFPASLFAELRGWPEDRLCRWLVTLHAAYGPPGLRHWSQLSPNEQAYWLKRAPILAQTHEDWPDPLKWFPRRLSAWFGPMPRYEDILMGNLDDPSQFKPIPPNGRWYVLRGFRSSTDENGIHNRDGWRPDDVDGYHELSFTVKKVN